MNNYAIAFETLPRPFCAEHPRWIELYDLAWRLAANHINETRGRQHMDAAWDPTRNYQWVWDTSFMTMYCRYAASQYPGIQSLDNFYDLQREDGFIAMCYCMDEGIEPWPGCINPPLFAWVEWEHYKATSDDSRFTHAIPHIEKLMEWIEINRRNQPHRSLHASVAKERLADNHEDNYQLYYFADCGASGMDNAPRTPRYKQAGEFFDWIDLSSQMVLSFKHLAKMHAHLGNEDAAAGWTTKAEETAELINKELWCENTHFYHDRAMPNNFVASKTVAGFWPMLAGICGGERLDHLVSPLLNEKEFDRPIPIPSLSADDANYDDKGSYWQGGVWAPTNYMVTRGLMLSGRGDVAHSIAGKYLDGLVAVHDANEPHTIWEACSPEFAKPSTTGYDRNQRVKPHFVGWSGLGPIAMLIENIIGVHIDAPARQITWDVRLTEEHGIDNLALGNARVDLRCQARDSISEQADITVSSTESLTLLVNTGHQTRTADLSAGEEMRLEV